MKKEEEKQIDRRGSRTKEEQKKSGAERERNTKEGRNYLWIKMLFKVLKIFASGVPK